jgi:glucosamine kinase
MILIADAGNTKTDWVLTGSGQTFRRNRTTGISPYFDSEAKIRDTFAEARNAFLDADVKAIYYYGTGCNDISKQEMICRCLRAVHPETGTVEVSDDLTGAGIALFGNDTGVAVITGTGSNAGITSCGKINRRIISLGYLLGDEGSGATIGLAFLRQLLGERLPGEVREAFYAWKETTPEGMITELYQAGKPQTVAASMVPFLLRYRHEEMIKDIITSSFTALLDQMVFPIRGDQKTLRVGFCGSIAFFFREELLQVCQKHGVDIADIIREPGMEIAAYHSGKMF